MKRSKPLRRTPMPRRKSTLQPKQPLSTKRGRTRPKPKKQPPPGREFWQQQRSALYVRAGGRCEWGGCDLTVTGMEAHHRKLRSRGGGHELSNLAALCPDHHKHVHANPQEATTRGFMVAAPVDPAAWAMTLASGRVVLLTDAGSYELTGF